MLRRAILGRRPAWTLARAMALAAGAFVVFGHLLIPVRGEGPSMLPTVQDGELVFVNTLAYRRSTPQRGDIVAISLAGRRVLYVKRVVGLPGERLSIEDGRVYANDVPLVEPYVNRRHPWQVPETTLGPEEYLVIGDNRGMAVRLHDFGKVRRERIIGKVMIW